MSSRFNDRKKNYSRSRSKSWSRDHHRMNRENQRRHRDQYKSRYDQRKNLKDNLKQCHVSIDWKPKSNSEKYKHNLKYSRSRSVSSSSSSSSSSYSSSGSKSRINKRGQKKERDFRRKKSSQKNRDKDRRRSLSRSESKNNSKKQLDEKHRDTQYKKYEKRQKDKKFQSHYQSHKNQHLNKHYVGGNKAIEHTKTYQKSYQNIGNEQKFKNDDEKRRENQNRRKIEIKKQASKMQNVDNNSQKKIENQNEKKNIEIQMGKKTSQILKQDTKDPVNHFIQTIKKVQNTQSIIDAQKEKVSKVTELINESKRNLQITPIKTNFLILDSFRSLKKFNAQTLDPTLFNWLQKDFQLYYEHEKSKVFAKESIIGEQRQNARICLPSHPSEQLIELKSQLQMLRGSMLNLNHMFRQLHIIQ